MAVDIKINGVSVDEVKVPLGVQVTFENDDTTGITSQTWKLEAYPKRVDDNDADAARTPPDFATNWAGWTVEVDQTVTLQQTAPTFPVVDGIPDLPGRWRMTLTDNLGNSESVVFEIEGAYDDQTPPAAGESTESGDFEGWAANRNRDVELEGKHGGNRIRVYNGTGAQLNAGKICKLDSVVDFRGVAGNTVPAGSATVALNVWSVVQGDSDDANADQSQYVRLEQNIANDSMGWARVRGQVEMNLTGFTQHQLAYMDENGDVVANPSGANIVDVGTVVKTGASGVLYFNGDPGGALNGAGVNEQVTFWTGTKSLSGSPEFRLVGDTLWLSRAAGGGTDGHGEINLFRRDATGFDQSVGELRMHSHTTELSRFSTHIDDLDDTLGFTQLQVRTALGLETVFRVDAKKNVEVRPSGSLISTAVDGFTYVARMAGLPANPPAGYRGVNVAGAVVVDESNDQFLYHSNGWRYPNEGGFLAHEEFTNSADNTGLLLQTGVFVFEDSTDTKRNLPSVSGGNRGTAGKVFCVKNSSTSAILTIGREGGITINDVAADVAIAPGHGALFIAQGDGNYEMIPLANVGEAASSADWDLTKTRYYFIDNDNGDDNARGYIDDDPDTDFTSRAAEVAAVALKTREELSNRIPRIGNDRTAQALFKPRSGGGTYKKKDTVTDDSLDLGYAGYSRLTLRGSDHTNTAADKAQCGGVIDIVGPNGDQSWSVGSFASNVITVAAGTLPAAETDLAGRKVRWKGDVTSALANEGNQVQKRVDGTNFQVVDNPGSTPVAGDDFFLDTPGVVFADIINAPIANNVGTFFPGLAIAGFRFTGFVLHSLLDAMQMQFVRFDGSTNIRALNGLVVSTFYNDENGSVQTRCGLDCRNAAAMTGALAGILRYSVFHSTTSLQSFASGGDIGSSCLFIGKLTIKGGAFGGIVIGSILDNPMVVRGSIEVQNDQRSDIGFETIEFSGTNGVVLQGEGHRIGIQNFSGSVSGNLVDLTGTQGTQVVDLGGHTATAGAEVAFADGVNKTFAALADDSWVDTAGNEVISPSARRRTFSAEATFASAAAAKWDALAAEGNANLTGAVATDELAMVRFKAPTIAGDTATATVTDAATFAIDGAPAAGANVTLTNPWALWVKADDVRFGGADGLTWDSANKRLGIGGTPTEELDVIGSAASIGLKGSGAFRGRFQAGASAMVLTSNLDVFTADADDTGDKSWEVWMWAKAPKSFQIKSGSGGNPRTPITAFEIDTNNDVSIPSGFLGVGVTPTVPFHILNANSGKFTVSDNASITAQVQTPNTSNVASYECSNTSVAVVLRATTFAGGNDGEVGTRNGGEFHVVANNVRRMTFDLNGAVEVVDATTVPTSDPSNGYFLWSEGNALKGRGGTGAVYDIGPAGGASTGASTKAERVFDISNGGGGSATVSLSLGDLNGIGNANNTNYLIEAVFISTDGSSYNCSARNNAHYAWESAALVEKSEGAAETFGGAGVPDIAFAVNGSSVDITCSVGNTVIHGRLFVTVHASEPVS